MGNLTDHFERVVVISLPARMDRRRRLSRHLQERQLGNGIEWVDAVPSHVSPVPAGWSSGPGAWGCLQSHLNVLRQGEADSVESLLILEDDVVFSPHTSRCLTPLMAAVPGDWGQFYLGGQHLANPSRTESPLVWRAGNINRTHAWACRGNHIPDIISHLSRLDDFTRPSGWHLDHQLGRAHELGLWPCYASSWWLAGQAADSSDICNGQLPRRWWHPRRYALQLPFIQLPAALADDGNEHTLTGNEARELDAVLPRDTLLAHWLLSLAEVALDHGCLPAWRSKKLCPERVAALWPGGVRSSNQNDLYDYPFNGLFRHPLATALQAPECFTRQTEQIKPQLSTSHVAR